MPLITLNHVVAMLGFILAASSYLLMRRYGFPERICVGTAILASLATAIFWTGTLIGTEDDDE